jgi:hypothetical protein
MFVSCQVIPGSCDEELNAKRVGDDFCVNAQAVRLPAAPLYIVCARVCVCV